MKKIKLNFIAETVKGKLNDSANADIEIAGVKGFENASIGDITFADSQKHIDAAEKTECAAIICSYKINSIIKPCIWVDNPKMAFAQTLGLFCNEPIKTPEISERASVHPTAKIAENVYVGPNAVIDKDAVIGKNSVIYAGVYIGERAIIGENVKIYANVSIYYDCKIGNNVIIHSNTVIGSDGFGYAQTAVGHFKVPQIGNVVIGDNVEIGASSSIDRATTMSTKIGNGVKIDNQVHIAHNVQIGDNTLMIAQAAIAGSAQVGKNCIIAGQTGIRDHVSVGDNTIIAPRTGVTKDVKGNVILSGFPAKPHADERKMKAAYIRMPETLKTVNSLQQAILRLQRRLEKIELKK